jgi:hypothetical protein
MFRCECGNTKILCGTDVSQGKTKSCGCHRGKYIASAHRLPEGEAAFNSLFLAYKNCARFRNLEFLLTLDEFKKLTKGNCKYCGVEPAQSWKGSSMKCSPYIYNGVDRTKNEQGYISSNTVSCCQICNQAKHNMKLNDFIAWLDRVVKFRHPESDATSIGEN